ncbi:MAG: hypothetical protein ACM3N4_13840 [Nitrososphaerota archaeon]
MVYRFCVASDAYGADAYDDSERDLAYAAYLLKRDSDAASLLVNSILPALLNVWYAQQGAYPPARDQMLRDLGERAPDIAEHLRLALRAPDAYARIHAAQRLLDVLRGEARMAAR